MIIIALILGFAYGLISVKGQFCMNSGFSNVVRKKDTTKLKSFIVAILIQMAVLPLLFTALYFNDATSYLVANIGLPSLFLVGTAIGGFLFGIFMHFTAGCGAGIFYKIGEKNSGAAIAVIGFVGGAYLAEKGLLKSIREAAQSFVVFDQQAIWKMQSPWLVSSIVALVATLILFLLFKTKDSKPGGAIWPWKKTGISIGILGIVAWMSAILAGSPYGMAIIPGAVDIVDLNYSWGLMFLLGIPLGSFWSSKEKKEKRFAMPKINVIAKRLFGGLGLGISGSVAAGCTVGHGLTFSPLLGVGSLIGILFIFLGSGTMGYLTRK